MGSWKSSGGRQRTSEVNQVTCALYQLSNPSPSKTESPQGNVHVLTAWNFVVNYIWLSNSNNLHVRYACLLFNS